MIRFTEIVRRSDFVPLATSFETDAETRLIRPYKEQAKAIYRQIVTKMPRELSIEAESVVFHIIMDEDAIYLALCDRAFSASVAFSYIEEVHREFQSVYGQRIASADRPYAFVEFGMSASKGKQTHTTWKKCRFYSHISLLLMCVCV
jgi:vesicle transport protein SEC22